MTEGYWRTTQAASELGISPHHMRKICEANLVEAERTQGGQWRIPMQEVNRLKKDGVPPVPLTAEPEPKAKQASQNGRTELLAPPTAAAAAAVEEVVISDAELKVRRNKLEKLEITKKATEVGDFFRNRRRQEADDEAARQRREREEQEERQRQIQQQQAAERRREWRDEWIRYGQNARPHNAPETIELDIVEQVERVLEALDPSRDESVVQRQVDAAVKRALTPWKAAQEKQEAIESALRYEAAFYDPQRNRRAREAAAEAIESLRDGAGQTEMKNAATAAVQPVIREYKHAQKCEEIVSGVYSKLTNETYQERQDAQDAVRQALAELPPGASDRQIELACETALRPIRDRIAARLDEAARQTAVDRAESNLPWRISDRLKQETLALLREAVDGLPAGTPPAELDRACARIVESAKKAHERHQQKESLVDDGMGKIYGYLLQLEKEYKFDKSAWGLEQDIRESTRKALWEELTGKETAEQVAGIVRRLVREELEIG